MSLTLQIKAEDFAREKLNLLENAFHQPRELNQYVADSCSAITRELFAELGNRPNKNHWKPTGFWQRMLSGTLGLGTDEAAIVRMPNEVAQRYFGGMLYPTGEHKFLAIPAREEANDQSPREFDDLHFVPTGPNKGMLVQNDQSEFYGRKRKDGTRKSREIGGGVFYFLVQSVWQAADPSVLPSDADYLEAARQGVNAFLETYL